MPTGYTDNIKDGITFKEYALQCARAFGACIDMRDESRDIPIPEEFQTSNYHLEEVQKLEKELKELQQISDAEFKKKTQEQRKECIKSLKLEIKENELLEKKYNSMLEKVNSWNPPSEEHKKFKEFMIDQIEISKTDYSSEYYFKELERMKKPVIFSELRIEEEKDILRDIEYHKRNYEEEILRVKGRNNWIKQLRDSFR